MQHRGIVRVIESFEANNTSYIVMEYLGGGNLDDRIVAQGTLSEATAIQLTLSIGDALVYMHSHHMLHLDLKPSNVMLDDQGNPVVIDFGLSKQYGADGVPESSTTVGGGTPGYAPIEQASYHEGKGFPVTIDVYALGATLFKMLTGHKPPEASDLFEEGFPYDKLKGVSKTTVDVVAKAMSSHKGDRYQSVRQMLEALPVNENTIGYFDEVESDEINVVSTSNLPKAPVRKPEPIVQVVAPTEKKKIWFNNDWWTTPKIWITILIELLLIVAGYFLYPFFLWLLEDDDLMTPLAVILTGVAFVVFIVTIFVARSHAKKEKSKKKKSGSFWGYPVTIFTLLVLLLLSVNNVTFFTRDVAWYDNAWGNCLARSYGGGRYLYTKFGVEKVGPVGDKWVDVYRVINRNAEEEFVVIQFDFATGNYYAALYDGNGDFVRKLDMIEFDAEHLKQEGLYIQGYIELPSDVKIETAQVPESQVTDAEAPAETAPACQAADY